MGTDDVPSALIGQLLLPKCCADTITGITILLVLLESPWGWLTVHQLSNQDTECSERIRQLCVRSPHPLKALLSLVPRRGIAREARLHEQCVQLSVGVVAVEYRSDCSY
jgi:hypothetical protein